MFKQLNCVFIGVILTASFFLFSGRETSLKKAPSFNGEPSMIPGAQSVRPLAANESLRVQELLTDLGAPAPAPSAKQGMEIPAEPGPDFTGAVESPGHNPHVKEWSYVKRGQKVLIRTDFYNVETGGVYARSWERMKDGKLARRIDEIFDVTNGSKKRYFTLFGKDGQILKKDLDSDADGRRDQQLIFSASKSSE